MKVKALTELVLGGNKLSMLLLTSIVVGSKRSQDKICRLECISVIKPSYPKGYITQPDLIRLRTHGLQGWPALYIFEPWKSG